MPKASVTRLINNRKDKLIEFVLDIEKYPEFIPFCDDSKVYERNENVDTITDSDIKLLNSYQYNSPESLRKTLFNNLETEFKTSSPDHVSQKWLINCVGYTGKPNVDACEEDKQNCWDLNVTFPTLLANECAKYNIKIT